MTHLESKSVSSKLVSTLFKQRKAGKYCDVTLKLGEVQLKAHGCVIAAFSNVFEKLMSNREVTQEPDSSRTYLVSLNCPKFSCVECATKVIEFMYIGKIQIDDHHLEHIKSVSESLKVSELQKICKQHFDKCSMRGNIEFGSPTSDTSISTNVSSSSLDCSNEPPQHKTPTLNKEHVSASATVNLLNNTSVNDEPLDESEWSGMKCPKCDLVLMSTAKYQQHCSTHLGKTYTTCCVCNYASIRVFDVIKHLQETDHNESLCSICLLQLGSNQSFKEHLQIHDQSQPFFCLTCNTRFQTRTALNSHIVRHTNETPFVCKECGRGFKWKHGLRSHMVTHSKLKSFLCDQCGFSTAHLRSFIDHKTIHSGEKFKCPKPDCQFSSVRKESVKHHLMTHSKERPYQCEVCGQAFSQSKNLRRHATLHNPSADPEKCPFCPFQTSRSDKFKAHFKRYHKDGSQTEINHRKRKTSSVSLSGVPENVKETAKTLAALSTCLFSTSDSFGCNQTSTLSKNEIITSPNGKNGGNIMERKQGSLIPINSVQSNTENCVTDMNANLGNEMTLCTCNSKTVWSQDKSTLCACNMQKSSPFSIPHRNSNDKTTVTCLNVDMRESHSSLCIDSSNSVQSYPNLSTVKYPVTESGKHTSNLYSHESINSMLETEEIVASSGDQDTCNGNSVGFRASTIVARPIVCSNSSPASVFPCTDSLTTLKVSTESDKIEDSLASALRWSLPSAEYQVVNVNHNVLELPLEDKLSGYSEPSQAIDEKNIVIDADEVFTSSSSDPVFVIPDGTFIIMDMVDMSLEPATHPPPPADFQT